MTKTTVSPLQKQERQAQWHSTRWQTTMVVPQVSSKFQLVNQPYTLPTTVCLVSPLDHRRLHHSAVGQAQRSQSSDHTTHSSLLVGSSTSSRQAAFQRVLSHLRRYVPASSARDVCGHGWCNTSSSRRCLWHQRGSTRSACVLSFAPSAWYHSQNSNNRWKSTYFSNDSGCMATCAHSAMSHPYPTSRVELVSSTSQTNRCTTASPYFSKSLAHSLRYSTTAVRTGIRSLEPAIWPGLSPDAQSRLDHQ